MKHDEPQEQSQSAADPAKERKKAKRKMLIAFGAALLVVLACYFIWLIFFAGKDGKQTDNAYTAVEVAQVTPLVSGPVKKRSRWSIPKAVHAGDVLVVLDDTDAKIALEQAEA
ncbi:EmrA/EmrK family multidrug efflux transporter periplasmic adaptor subunit, partial [Pseudomonas putida]